MKPDQQRKTLHGIVSVALLAAVAMQVLVFVEMRRLRDAVQLERRLPVQELVTTWTDKQGNEHTVRTERLPGEPADAFAQRHQDAVLALQAIFPPC